MTLKNQDICRDIGSAICKIHITGTVTGKIGIPMHVTTVAVERQKVIHSYGETYRGVTGDRIILKWIFMKNIMRMSSE
jgi:ribosomal protein S6E (S10)